MNVAALVNDIRFRRRHAIMGFIGYVMPVGQEEFYREPFSPGMDMSRG